VTVGFPDDTDSMIPRPAATIAPMPSQIGATRLEDAVLPQSAPLPHGRLTPQVLQDVFRKYFSADRSTVITLVPAPTQP
jgi:hypothetical protein